MAFLKPCHLSHHAPQGGLLWGLRVATQTSVLAHSKDARSRQKGALELSPNCLHLTAFAPSLRRRLIIVRLCVLC